MQEVYIQIKDQTAQSVLSDFFFPNYVLQPNTIEKSKHELAIILVLLKTSVGYISPFLQTYSFSHIKEKRFRKTLWKKVKLLKMSNFTFSHHVFYSICILKSFNSHISVVCSFFKFETVSKWCIGERVKTTKA